MQRILFVVWACAWFLCVGSINVHGAVGDLDPAFGQGGIVLTDFFGGDN